MLKLLHEFSLLSSMKSLPARQTAINVVGKLYEEIRESAEALRRYLEESEKRGREYIL